MLGVPASKRLIAANFFTPSYRILGKVQIGNSGLIGMLNDTTTAFVELHDVTMARVHEPRVLADRLDLTRLVKRGLEAIGVGRREDIGPQSIARGGFGRMTEYGIRAMTATFEVEGILEYAGRFELAAVLIEGMGEFIPFYEARLRAIQFPDLFMESPAILLNRRKIDIVTQLQQGNPPS